MYIVCEGCDYAGKTELSKGLAKYLEDQGYPVLLTHEPNNEAIREIVKTGAMPWSSAYLFMADHLHNQLELVAPQLSRENGIVVQDRHTRVSQAVYQLAHTNRLDPLIIDNPDFRALPVIDLLIFLDVPVEELIRRSTAQKRRESEVKSGVDVYDGYDLRKRTYLRNAYNSIIRSSYIDSVARQVATISWVEGETLEDTLNYTKQLVDSELRITEEPTDGDDETEA